MMDKNDDKYLEEIRYLDEIINLLLYKLEEEKNNLENQRADLIESKKRNVGKYHPYICRF